MLKVYKTIIVSLMILVVSCTFLTPIDKAQAESPVIANQAKQQIEENNKDKKKEDKKKEIVKEKKVYEGRILKEQERFPVSHYALETYFPKDFASFVSLGYSQSGQQISKGLGDSVWQANKTLSETFIYIIGEMMTYNLIEKLAEPVGLTLERISGVNSENGVFSSFLTLFVALMAGSLVIMYYIQNNTSGAVKALISSLLILVGCYWFYGNATQNLKHLNTLTAEAEGVVAGWSVNFSSSADKTENEPYTIKETKAVLQNELFNLMVKRPYLNMMYGTSDEAEITKGKGNSDRITKLLELKTWNLNAQEARNEIVKEEVEKKNNENMSILTVHLRIATTFLYLVATIFLGIPFLALGALKITIQVIFVASLLLSPALLLFSLIPAFQATAGYVVKKLLGLLVSKIGITFLVTIAVGITTLLYETTPVSAGFAGHAYLVFMECLVLFALFKYKNQMFTIASSARGYVESAGGRITHHATNHYNKTKQTGKKGVEYAVKRIRQSNYRKQQEQRSNRNAPQNSNTSNGVTKPVKPSLKRENGQVSSTNVASTNNKDTNTGMGNKSTISSSKPLKQSSVRQNEKTNPVKEAKQEEKPQVYIPIPMSKENNKQENEKTKMPNYIPIPQSNYRQSPAREKRRVVAEETQSPRREDKAKKSTKAIDNK
ncbi:CD3337/EF1877 family mobilome membrane protein [Priestia aryabhattai]|uniref:CD3337/EF1877 family mobilome membrane protein n=1 Tax=Priestia aryabhattai TaxID=412384 RepID=UPI002E22C78A|nr:hypothetical protein [Priestia aryabhattai]